MNIQDFKKYEELKSELQKLEVKLKISIREELLDQIEIISNTKATSVFDPRFDATIDGINMVNNHITISLSSGKEKRLISFHENELMGDSKLLARKIVNKMIKQKKREEKKNWELKRQEKIALIQKLQYEINYYPNDIKEDDNFSGSSLFG